MALRGKREIKMTETYKRESLIQVEPRLGQVLLGWREYDAFHRGMVLSVIELSPSDAIALAQCLASAAELIINTGKEMINGTGNSNATPNNKTTIPHKSES